MSTVLHSARRLDNSPPMTTTFTFTALPLSAIDIPAAGWLGDGSSTRRLFLFHLCQTKRGQGRLRSKVSKALTTSGRTTGAHRPAA
mmetsp:Transcript_18817/g.44075  ORF Transcript_18817/g.44075 Transcript_18817/m.44075 type:complete len:86 (-) Transcript_18817:192-449(-)